MKITDVAAEVFYADIAESSITSIPSIAYWLRAKIGELNNLLYTDFTVNDSGEVIDGEGVEIPIEAVSILKKLYIIYYYGRIIANNLGAAGLDQVIEVSSDGSTVRNVDKNSIAKTYLALKRDEEENLNALIKGYSAKDVLPISVAGDDNIGTNGLRIPDPRRRY